MINPLSLLGMKTPPRISLGKAEAEWALVAYMQVAQRTNNWRVPFAEVVYEHTGLPRSENLPTLMTRRERTGLRKLTGVIKADHVEDETPPDQRIVDMELGLTIAALQEFITLKDEYGVTYLNATEKLVRTLLETVSR